MISLEMARKLKDAGLEWDPKKYDYFQLTILEKPLTTCLTDDYSVKSYQKESQEIRQKHRLWLPRLDQLLAGIEKLGYEWAMAFCRAEGYVAQLWIVGKKKKLASFTSKAAPDDAVAEALLWILEGRRS
ncbi:MAG: hypothetical protein GXY34_00185 [Syntrophomonadaceae bacterium]|nr:hypothetical protein [Syntrophomonadaceae bacterium]